MTRGAHDRGRPDVVVGPLACVLIAAAVISACGGLLALLGWASGGLAGSPVGLLAGALMLTAGFGVVAYREATTARPAGQAPEPSGAVVEVHSSFGMVFWVFAALAAAAVAVAVFGASKLLQRSGNNTWSDVTGLAAIGATMVVAMFLVALILAAAALPTRIIRSYGRTHLWVSHEGIGYPPLSDDDPGFRRWNDVVAVTHSARDARGIVYSHEWTIRTTNTLPSRIVVGYPAGATPRPRAIRRAISDLAPDVEVR